LRLAIEPDAAARASLIATPADHDAAQAALAALDVAARDALHEVALLNRAFHLALVRPFGGTLTFQLIERLQVLAERYVVQHLKPAGREDRAHQEHRALLDAWLSRDGAKVSALLIDHVRATMVDLRGQLKR
jgi:DNA-binding GntR family transcriptional regulator